MASWPVCIPSPAWNAPLWAPGASAAGVMREAAAHEHSCLEHSLLGQSVLEMLTPAAGTTSDVCTAFLDDIGVTRDHQRIQTVGVGQEYQCSRWCFRVTSTIGCVQKRDNRHGLMHAWGLTENWMALKQSRGSSAGCRPPLVVPERSPVPLQGRASICLARQRADASILPSTLTRAAA